MLVTLRKRKMPITLRGVMQAPVTPLKDDFSFDGDGFAKMVDFHIRHGAPAIAWPHHKAESLNLSIEERKIGAEAAVRGRPVACRCRSSSVRSPWKTPWTWRGTRRR